MPTKRKCPIKSKSNSKNCSVATDALIVSNQRSLFSQILDDYINGNITRDMFIAKISPLISDTFTTALVKTPLGNTGPFIGKQAFINWLANLPETTFAGFADHRLMNLQIDPVDNSCNPNIIIEKNKSPNLLRIKAGTGSLLVWEVSNEEATWVRSNLITKDKIPRANCNSSKSTWLMESYLVNSTELFLMSAVDIDLYNLPATSIKNTNNHVYKIPQDNTVSDFIKKK